MRGVLQQEALYLLSAMRETWMKDEHIRTSFTRRLSRTLTSALAAKRFSMRWAAWLTTSGLLSLSLLGGTVLSQSEGETRTKMTGNGIGGCDLRIENGEVKFGDVQVGGNATAPVFKLRNASAFASCEVLSIESTAPYFQVVWVGSLPTTIPPNGAVEHFADATLTPSMLGPVEADLVVRWRTVVP